jgi:hypothetical protein
MKRDLISVALCTYNGAAYLRQQLDSISRQTRLPDQVLIRDDGSKDETVPIAKQWASEVPFAVQVEVNPQNLGPSRNFARAIQDVQGDLIALSDQDDVWMPDKLEKIERYFSADPVAEALFTNAWVVDEALNRCGLLSEAVKFQSAAVQREIAAGSIVRRLSFRNIATGATMALRARLREKVFPLPERLPLHVLHDGWIAVAAAVRGTLRFLDLPLILYRQHPAQTAGLEQKPGDLESPRWRWRSIDERNAMLANAAQEIQILSGVLHARFPENAQALKPFVELASHRHFRGNRSPSLPGRIFPVLKHLALGRYHRYDTGWRHAIGDLLF